MAHEAGELGIVPDAMEERVEEYRPAIGVEGPHRTGFEVNWFDPVDFGREKLLEDLNRTVVSGVDRFYGIEWNAVVIGDREAGEAFGIAKLRGDNVMEEFGDELCACDVTGFG